MLLNHVEEFVRFMRLRNLAHTTIDTWRPACRAYVKWLEEDQKIASPDLEHFCLPRLQAYLEYLTEDRENRPRSVKRNFAALRAFGEYLIEKGLWYDADGQPLANPAKLVKLPKMDEVQRDLVSDEEVTNLLAAAERIADPVRRALARAVLSVLCYGALRRQELFDLRIADVNVSAGVIYILHGKGDKFRSPYPAPECMEAITQWLKARPCSAHDYLWAIDQKRRLGEVTLNKILNEVKHIAGYADRGNILPHSIRHNCATYLHQHGYSLEDLRLFLGHSHVSTTALYVHSDLERLRALAKKGSRSPEATPPTPTPLPSAQPPTVPPGVPKNGNGNGKPKSTEHKRFVVERLRRPQS